MTFVESQIACSADANCSEKVKSQKRTKQANREAMTMHRQLEFFAKEKLTKLHGNSNELWPSVLDTESVDNAIDHCEEAGLPQEISIFVSKESFVIPDNERGNSKNSIEYGAILRLIRPLVEFLELRKGEQLNFQLSPDAAAMAAIRILQAQSLFPANHYSDAAKSAWVIYADTLVRRDFNQLFTEFLELEFGKAAFQIERTIIMPAAVWLLFAEH